MYTLYTAAGSCGLASHIALAESGLPYTARLVDFAGNEQRSAAYLAINPKGRVPALATPRGVLTETVAILAFVAQSAPAAALAPLDDPFAFARMQAFNTWMASTVHVAYAHARRASRWADKPESHADMAAKAPANFADCMALVEGDYLAGPFVLDEGYSVADPYLYTIAGWMPKLGLDPAAYPCIAAHRALMQSRPAVQRAEAELQG